MKIVRVISLITVIAVLIGIGGFVALNTGINEQSDALKIVCTVYSAYDFAKEITEDVEDVEIYLLTDNGIDLHNYTPSVTDIAMIKDSDLFIYVDGESDFWVEDIIEEDTNTLKLMDELGDLIESEHDHDYEEEDHVHDEEESYDHEEEDHDHNHEYDEHVWMSIENASVLVSSISTKIIELDEVNREIYELNTSNYKEELASLNEEYKEALSGELNILIIAGRNPFKYLTRDYDIESYAAYDGCSAEYEVSFETVISLAETAKEHNVEKIVVEKGGNQDIAESIMENSDVSEILELDSMQSINLKDEYKTYLEIARENLQTLKDVLK